VRDVDGPGALEDARARHHDAALLHGAAVHERRRVTGDEHEDFRRIGEAVIADRDPVDDVGRDMIDKNQPEREAAKQIKAQVSSGRDNDGHELLWR
jgi:hypothetical protein